MKKIILSISFFMCLFTIQAQKFFSKTATIQFDASGPIEKIQAKNGAVAFVLNTESGEIQTSAQIKSFVFDRSLMQEHFNENYMESEKFPKSNFKGNISNNTEINYKVDGTYTAKVSGKLTIHGVTKDVNIVAKIIIKESKIKVESQFNINCSDYAISIPGAVKDKVANQVKITITGNLDKMQ